MLAVTRIRRVIVPWLVAITFVTSARPLAQATGRPLSLPDAVARSLSHPALRAARESVAQARADEKTASLTPNPTLSAEAALLPLGRRYTPEEPGGPTEVSAGLSYPIDWLLFGKRAAAVAAAGGAVGVAEADYRNTARLRTLETTIAFYAVLEAQALHAVAAQAVDALTRMEAAIQKAVADGGRAAVEWHRVRIEVQGARRDEREARAALAAATSVLTELVAADPAAGPVTIDGTLEGPIVAEPLPVEAAISRARAGRPDLDALRLQVEKARSEARLESRNARPEAAINVGLARQLQQAIGAPDVTAWGISVDVGLPLFDRNQGNRLRARSAIAQAEYAEQAASSALRAEIDRAAEALRAAKDNATDLSLTTLELAGQVRDSLRKAYDAGGRPLVDLLDAQRSYRETYQDYVRSRAEYWRALAQYEAVLGTRLSR